MYYIKVRCKFYIVCHDLDIRSEIFLWKSLFTIFEVSIGFWCSWGSGKNWLEQKPNCHRQILTVNICETLCSWVHYQARYYFAGDTMAPLCLKAFCRHIYALRKIVVKIDIKSCPIFFSNADAREISSFAACQSNLTWNILEKMKWIKHMPLFRHFTRLHSG